MEVCSAGYMIFLKTDPPDTLAYCVNGLPWVCINAGRGAEWEKVGQLARYHSTPDWKQ